MTENGWPPDTNAHPNVSIPLSACVQVTIPGTSETLWFQKGWPSKIMPAFAADINWYVESLNNSQGYNDEGTWTNGNSVGTSNHLGATAMDLNWSDHPMGPQVPDPAAGWQWSQIVGGPEEPRVRELLKFYTADDGTQLIWWGNDWDSPHDSMHFQMGYGTYQNQAVQRWIDKNIDPQTGMSRFKIFKQNPLPVDNADSPAKVLYDAVPEFDETTAANLAGEIMLGLADSQCNTVQRIAMWLAQIGHESGGFVYTEEIAKNGPYAPYIGRTWIQITWQSNYAAFGKWCLSQGFITDPNQFVDNPQSLADPQWAGVGPAWYWTVARPTINSLCDQGDIVSVTQLINGGQNGIDERTAKYNQAIALGDRLLLLAKPGGGVASSDPAVITQDEWDALKADVREILVQLSGDWPQNGNDPKAAADLDKLKASGARLTPNDLLCWIKNHTSTHKSPTP